MIIDKNIKDLVIFSEDTLYNALHRINANKIRCVFCVSSSGQLEGVLTDGDVRRWITSNPSFDINVRALDVANRDFFSLSSDASHDDLRHGFSDRINVIPLVDRQRHLVGVARKWAPELRIGADCAKFQMRSMRALYRNAGDETDASADLGAQYTLDLLSRFQLPNEALFEVFDYCKERGILPLCTPWDEESLAALDAYGMPAFKLASADLTNHELLAAMARTGKLMICSTGMSNEFEIVDAVQLLKKHSAPYVLLHCNSTYPAPFKDIQLKYMDRLKEIGDTVVGYSGHERGINVAIAAVARGARVVEKHFTVDRAMEGNDHRVSLLPDEFRQMVEGIREVETALGSSERRTVTQGEMMNREVLGKSLIASRPIAKGDIIVDDMIEVRSPGQGLAPYHRVKLVNRVARRDFKPGDFFFPTDLEEAQYEPRAFQFRRPFGIPVRYHDFRQMLEATNFDLLEFHFSYRDLDERAEDYLGSDRFDLDLVVHSPELFAGDHLMDLASNDPEYRARSIAELQRVVDVTRGLSRYFTRATRPQIIINAGGFSLDGPMPRALCEPLYARIADALEQVDQDGVEIIPQTMPPFPWHFGGQRFHNLFVTPEDIVAFGETYGYRSCLDISHSQLACTHQHRSFKDFLEQVAPFAAHLHVVDAQGVDGEGLQIGEGVVDFAMVAEVLDRKAPKASFIPEVWQGHKNGGAGFWEALTKLEAWL